MQGKLMKKYSHTLIFLLIMMFNSSMAFAITPLMLDDISTILPNVKTRADIDKFVQIRENPNPIQSYEFNIHLKQIPQNFTLTSATVYYINDNSCRYKLDSIGIIGDYRPSYGHLLSDKEMDKINKSQFKITVYDDLLIADDYFKTGIMCRWLIGQIDLAFENKSQKTYIASLYSPLAAENLTIHYNDPVDSVKIDVYGTKGF